MTTGNKFAAGLFAGALAGAVAGMLLAPKPGKETRHIIANRVGDVCGKAEGRFATWRRVRGNGQHAEVDQTPSGRDVVASS
jgi:gas vesicle protein